VTIKGTPEQAAQKWLQRLSASTQQIQEGVARVSEAPGAKAAAAKSAYLANVQAKADKWERNVKAVTLESWKAATTAGAQRVAAGAQAKVGKMEAFQRDFFPFLQTVQDQVERMPKGTLEQGIARMVKNAQLISQYRRNR